jgi:High-affinity nickel-transport protein
MSAPLNVVLLSCALLGFRHGFDYDHIAAITDIAGMQTRVSNTMRFGLMYALGHASTVALLGGLVIAFQLTLPHSMDRWAERFVGLTLIVLAIYVLSTLILRKGHVMPKSRAAMLISATRWLHGRYHRWRTGKMLPPTEDRLDLSDSSCFGIGIIHGLGAETPSQLALFLLAANLGGAGKGFMGLGVFLAGLLMMNTLMTASAAGVFTVGRSWSGWTTVITGLTAVYSFCIGVLFLLGYASVLHPING